MSAELVARERVAIEDGTKAVLAGVSFAALAEEWERGRVEHRLRRWTRMSLRLLTR